MKPNATVAIIGGGAWGTALANAAASVGHDAVLWMRDQTAAATMAATRENAKYLPGIELHSRVTPTANASALASCAFALLVTPAQSLRQVVRDLGAHLPASAPLVLCAKGIERETGLLPSEVAANERPNAPVAALSGPSFAEDVAKGLPTAVTLAAQDGMLAQRLAETLSGPALRVYHGTDLRGVEIGGAAKNVLAIACGAVAGRNLGESAKAALIARGFAELMRFAAAFGGQTETLMGLSGLGDLVLTCGSTQSRNFSLGHRLGRGIPLAEASGGKLAEGAFTAHILAELARKRGIDMPIVFAVDAILQGRLTVDQATDALMARPIKKEH